MIDYALYGRRLKEAREAKGWTVEDAAREAGLVYQQNIRAVDGGNEDYPLEYWLRYARALGIHPSDLFRDEGAPTRAELERQRDEAHMAARSDDVLKTVAVAQEAEYRRLRNECAMRLFASATPEYPTTAQDAFDAADLWLAELKRRDGK